MVDGVTDVEGVVLGMVVGAGVDTVVGVIVDGRVVCGVDVGEVVVFVTPANVVSAKIKIILLH